MKYLALLVLVGLTAVTGCGKKDKNGEPPAVAAAQEADARAEHEVMSGRIEDGLRVLTFDPARPGERFKIYRGDYVRPELVDGAPFTIEIPALGVDMSVPVPVGEKPYFKVPDAGVFEFRIGQLTGEIEAVEYISDRYKEVSAKEASAIINEIHPFVLDVRTPREYDAGHLQGATLVPVQALAKRIGELESHKDEPVLVYCHTGNRSTVAAKMLIDDGFKHVINMRHGIAEWVRDGLPVVQ